MAFSLNLNIAENILQSPIFLYPFNFIWISFQLYPTIMSVGKLLSGRCQKSMSAVKIFNRKFFSSSDLMFDDAQHRWKALARRRSTCLTRKRRKSKIWPPQRHTKPKDMQKNRRIKSAMLLNRQKMKPVNWYPEQVCAAARLFWCAAFRQIQLHLTDMKNYYFFLNSWRCKCCCQWSRSSCRWCCIVGRPSPKQGYYNVRSRSR